MADSLRMLRDINMLTGTSVGLSADQSDEIGGRVFGMTRDGKKLVRGQLSTRSPGDRPGQSYFLMTCPLYRGT
jgi:hypothetical protein